VGICNITNAFWFPEMHRLALLAFVLVHSGTNVQFRAPAVGMRLDAI
jgi:hypothetical protein